MKKFLLAPALLAASLVPLAKADTYTVNFAGSGVSGSLDLTYGSATDPKSGGFVVTGVSGTFSDYNLNILNAPVSSLYPIDPAQPEPGNDLAPSDFSRFAVATGLPAESHGFVTYSNLLYPNGSPQTANSYPFSGGIFDIYGLLFNIGNGQVVDLWSNGSFMGSPLDYGVVVATSATSLDYQGGGVQVTPEPSSYLLMGTGLLAMLFWFRRSVRFSR